MADLKLNLEPFSMEFIKKALSKWDLIKKQVETAASVCVEQQQH